MTRRQPKIRKTRDQILRAATEMFITRGYAWTSVDDIVEAAGCTRGAFYYYFEDKEDAVRMVQRRLWRRLAKHAEAAFEPTLGTVPNLKRTLGAHLSALDELGPSRRILREMWVDPSLESIGSEEFDRGVGVIEEFLAHSMRRGEIVAMDTRPLAVLLTGLFEVATAYALQMGDASTTIEAVNVLLDGLAVPAAL